MSKKFHSPSATGRDTVTRNTTFRRSASARNSAGGGLLALWRWLKPSSSFIVSSSSSNSSSSSSLTSSNCSLNSSHSTCSFAYVPAEVYQTANVSSSDVGRHHPDAAVAVLNSETISHNSAYDYYNDSILPNANHQRLQATTANFSYHQSCLSPEESTRSLPLMTKPSANFNTPPSPLSDTKHHRRTNSDSSKIRKAGAYLHVKGKRRAPQPPTASYTSSTGADICKGTLKKRAAPTPPSAAAPTLSPPSSPSTGTASTARLTRPWYRRKTNASSALTYLANISELDREAAQIVRENSTHSPAPPPFFRPKEPVNQINTNTLSNRRRSARDLIAKFNAICTTKMATQTAVPPIPSPIPSTKHSISAQKTDRSDWTCPKCLAPDNDYWRIICKRCSAIKPYFDDWCDDKGQHTSTPLIENTKAATKSNSLLTSAEPNQPPSRLYPSLLERSKTQSDFKAEKAIEAIYEEVAANNRDLMTSVTNEIKTESPLTKTKVFIKSKDETGSPKPQKSARVASIVPPPLTRSRTQIDVPHAPRNALDDNREKIKQMLIDMKNSLPKRKSKLEGMIHSNENRTASEQTPAPPEKTQEQKVTEILIGTQRTVYENVKMRFKHTSHANDNNPSTSKACASSQTPRLRLSYVEPNESDLQVTTHPSTSFEPMRPKDFEDIYSAGSATAANSKRAQIYANIAHEELSVFFQAESQSKTHLLPSHSDTIEVNRLLRRLEAAIAKGDLVDAAMFAKQLAQLKVNCSVVRQKNTEIEDGFNVEMYVEDRVSHRGPFPLRVTPSTTVGQLKKQVEMKFEIPEHVQRWILGKQLVTDDATTLAHYQVLTDGCPIFLYLVANEIPAVPPIKPKVIDVMPKSEPEPIYDSSTLKANRQSHSQWECTKCTLLNPQSVRVCNVCSTTCPNLIAADKAKPITTYLQLVDLDDADLVLNREIIQCPICLLDIAPGDGATLRDCLHQFCKQCLEQYIALCEDAQVRCPYRDQQYACQVEMQHREIRALVGPTLYDRHLARSVAQAESNIGKSFHCKSNDCTGWCIYEDNVNEFLCPVCCKLNCLTCQTIHAGLNCKEYQEKIAIESETDEEVKRTKRMLEEMVTKGEAITCPTCKIILMKKWGCDWLRCSMCKTEICWVTRGPRWGPSGKGDVSGGCQCGVNGIKCHPQCNYCH